MIIVMKMMRKIMMNIYNDGCCCLCSGSCWSPLWCWCHCSVFTTLCSWPCHTPRCLESPGRFRCTVRCSLTPSRYRLFYFEHPFIPFSFEKDDSRVCPVMLPSNEDERLKWRFIRNPNLSQLSEPIISLQIYQANAASLQVSGVRVELTTNSPRRRFH